MSGERLIVFRPALGLSTAVDVRWEGRWEDLTEAFRSYGGAEPPTWILVNGCVAVATARTETRDDGAVAEVWELRDEIPSDGYPELVMEQTGDRGIIDLGRGVAG